LHDFDFGGFASNTSSSTSLNVTFSNNVIWNSGTAVSILSPVTNTDWTFDSNLSIRTSGYGIYLGDVGGICTNNTAVGANGLVYGFQLAEGGPAAVIGTFNNNSAHACQHGFNASGQTLTGTVNNLTSWRNSGVGIHYNGINGAGDLVFNNLTLFGNNTNIAIANGDALTITGTSIIAGDTTFSSVWGFDLSASAGARFLLDLSSIDMSGTTSIFAPHTLAEFFTGNVGSTMSNLRGTVNNCKFGAPSLISRGVWLSGAYIGFEKYNQTAGDHRVEMTYGQLRTDSVIYNTAAPSMRMTPNNATNGLESAPRGKGMLVAVGSGGTVTVSVSVRKSSSADGTAYNGNQPRLIQRANPALGQNSDVVLATYTSGAGAWNTLSATSSVANGDDGAWEFIVDCNGTAGFINVDDWGAS
jgi:hypothetical protein